MSYLGKATEGTSMEPHYYTDGGLSPAENFNFWKQIHALGLRLIAGLSVMFIGLPTLLFGSEKASNNFDKNIKLLEKKADNISGDS